MLRFKWRRNAPNPAFPRIRMAPMQYLSTSDPQPTEWFHPFDLAIGAPVFVNFTPNRPQHAPPSRLRGWRRHHYLLIDEPRGLVPRDYRPASTWRLHILTSGHVLCAVTKFIQRSSNRFEGAFVTYPDAVTLQPVQRRHPRFALQIPSSYAVIDAQGTALTAPEHAVICDLSAGGCGLHVPERLRPGTLVRITLPLPDDAPPLLVRGQVRHCELHKAAVRYRVGLQFTHTTPPQQDAIRRLLDDAGGALKLESGFPTGEPALA